jgi:hypothetical protein
MSEERSGWDADTVEIGRRRREPSHPDPPRRWSARPKLPTIALRPVALVTFAIVGVVALIVVAGDRSGSQKAPLREVVDSAPRVAVKQAPRVPTRARRPEPGRVAKLQVRRKGASQHETEARAATQAPDASKSSTEPTLEYVPPPAPEQKPLPAPTPPATEFGL